MQRRKHSGFAYGESNISPQSAKYECFALKHLKLRFELKCTSRYPVYIYHCTVAPAEGIVCSLTVTLDSYFTSASLIFSRCATTVITRAVIQENKAKCSLFTYDFLSNDNDNDVTLSSAATNRIATERDGTLRLTSMHPRRMRRIVEFSPNRTLY